MLDEDGNREISNSVTVSYYWFELVRDSISMSGLVKDTMLVDTTKLVSGLINKTNYFWRIKSKNEAGWSSFTSWNRFATNVEIVLSKPNGGETWKVGETKDITWTSENVQKVKIQYSTNNGTNWLSIIDSLSASAAKYVWTIPNTPSIQSRVRITDLSNSDIGDSSNGAFTIQLQQSITVQAPNGGEIWKTGETIQMMDKS